jgi:hypothetical protein
VKHGGSYRKRLLPNDPDIWWEKAQMPVSA